jgi:hypothetical protein
MGVVGLVAGEGENCFGKTDPGTQRRDIDKLEAGGGGGQVGVGGGDGNGDSHIIPENRVEAGMGQVSGNLCIVHA